jgi:hypothetical protein
MQFFTYLVRISIVSMSSGRSHADVIRNPTLSLESVNDDRCRVWSLERGDNGIQMSSRVLSLRPVTNLCARLFWESWYSGSVVV